MREAQAVAGAAKHGFRMSLRWKLSLLITSLVGLAVVLVGLFLLRQQQQSSAQRQEWDSAHVLNFTSIKNGRLL
jgi:sensor histidine kinase regulating citrate/malate metabolism